MWSFGNKRDDHTQAPSGKNPNGNNQQQATPIRANGDPLPDQQQQPQHQQISPKGGGSLAAKSRLFYKNKKLSSSSHHMSSSIKNNPKPAGTQPRTPQQEIRKKRIFGGGNGHRRNSTSNDNDDYLQDVSVNETSNGIEVCFPGSQSSVTATGNKGKTDVANQPSVPNRVLVHNPVMSLKEQILRRHKVFKSQFSTVLPVSNNNAFSAENTSNWRPKGHRIPLIGIKLPDEGYLDSLQLLQNAPIVDEHTAVQQELKLLETEISSLQRDRIWLEQSLQSTSSNSAKTHFGSDSTSLNKENVMVTWDAHSLLKNDAVKKQLLSVTERNLLQKQRGNSLTIHLSNNRTREIFVLKFGGKEHNSRSMSSVSTDDTITTIVPNTDSSIDTGTTTLQHVSLIPPTSNSASNYGLYFSQDFGKSEHIGQLPDKLSRRFDASNGQPGIGDLEYLSTGSRGCYFAKFQSGETWWGSAVADADFQNILNSWDVYRVAFGPAEDIEYSNVDQQVLSDAPLSENKRNNKNYNKATSTNSWIILSHDGKAAWKNLPPRLSNKLERRIANSVAPMEVSLGPGDSYFVRFLDGTIDYSLPSKIARVCDRIEERGGNITNISLHPDISHDFIIRHTELTRY